MAIIFCAWAIISGVIMLGSMVFTGAGACDARAADQQLCEEKEGTDAKNSMAESARFSSVISMVHRPSQDATEFGVPRPG